MFRTQDGAKRFSVHLRKALAAEGAPLPLNRCQAAVAGAAGFPNWNAFVRAATVSRGVTAKGLLDALTTAGVNPAKARAAVDAVSPPGEQLGRPVSKYVLPADIRMDGSNLTKKFYVVADVFERLIPAISAADRRQGWTGLGAGDPWVARFRAIVNAIAAQVDPLGGWVMGDPRYLALQFLTAAARLLEERLAFGQIMDNSGSIRQMADIDHLTWLATADTAYEDIGSHGAKRNGQVIEIGTATRTFRTTAALLRDVMQATVESKKRDPGKEGNTFLTAIAPALQVIDFVASSWYPTDFNLGIRVLSTGPSPQDARYDTSLAHRRNKVPAAFEGHRSVMVAMGPPGIGKSVFIQAIAVAVCRQSGMPLHYVLRLADKRIIPMVGRPDGPYPEVLEEAIAHRRRQVAAATVPTVFIVDEADELTGAAILDLVSLARAGGHRLLFTRQLPMPDEVHAVIGDPVRLHGYRSSSGRIAEVPLPGGARAIMDLGGLDLEVLLAALEELEPPPPVPGSPPEYLLAELRKTISINGGKSSQPG